MQDTQPTMDEIRAAILKHHGGFRHATDAQLLSLWRSIPPYVQQNYLDKLTAKTKGAGDAPQS